MTAPADLAALRALLEKATPGPWWVDPEVRTANICTIYHTADAQGWTHVSGEMGRNPDRVENTANAALIVAMRNALPALLAEMEGLRAERNTYRKATAAFVAWLEAEDTPCDYGDLTRDTHPDGERIWRDHWDRNQNLCAKAVDLGRAALQSTTQPEGGADE